MSFWSGYMMGRMSNKDGGGSEGLAVIFVIIAAVASIHSFGLGIYNAADAVPRMLAYYTGNIDTRNSGFLACNLLTDPWLNAAIERYSTCFHYTRAFAWLPALLKTILLAGWFVLLLRALAGSRLAFWCFSIITAITVIFVWGVCGGRGCAAYYVAELKDWQYWHRNGGRNFERITTTGGYGALGGFGFVLSLLLLRYSIGKDRLTSFNERIFGRVSVYRVLSLIFGTTAIGSGASLVVGVVFVGLDYRKWGTINFAQFSTTVATFLIVMILSGIACRIFLRKARAKDKIDTTATGQTVT